jgi:isochorismate hydrolase
MVVPEVEKIIDSDPARNSVVLFGIETQVCVQQTTLDLLERGYNVHIVADGCSSRSQVDRLFAFERMRQSGAFVTTSESLIFELMGDYKHPKFKELQALVRTSAPDSALLTKL